MVTISLVEHFNFLRSEGCTLIVGLFSFFLEVSSSVNELFKKL